MNLSMIGRLQPAQIGTVPPAEEYQDACINNLYTCTPTWAGRYIQAGEVSLEGDGIKGSMDIVQQVG